MRHLIARFYPVWDQFANYGICGNGSGVQWPFSRVLSLPPNGLIKYSGRRGGTWQIRHFFIASLGIHHAGYSSEAILLPAVGLETAPIVNLIFQTGNRSRAMVDRRSYFVNIRFTVEPLEDPKS